MLAWTLACAYLRLLCKIRARCDAPDRRLLRARYTILHLPADFREGSSPEWAGVKSLPHMEEARANVADWKGPQLFGCRCPLDPIS